MIELMRFIPGPAIDSSWYERPYFLGPDGAAPDYGALVQALRGTDLRGIARWTMRGRGYFGALQARDSHLVLIALRSAGEAAVAAQLKVPEKTVSETERALAGQLIAALDGPFDPAELRDEYRERVLALVEAKSKGRAYKAQRDVMPEASRDLMRALKQSLQATRQKRRAAA